MAFWTVPFVWCCVESTLADEPYLLRGLGVSFELCCIDLLKPPDLPGTTFRGNRGPGGLHKYPNDFQKHGPHDHQHHEPSRFRVQSARYLTIDRQAHTRISKICGVQTNQTRLRT